MSNGQSSQLDRKQIGLRIKNKRKYLGLSREQLAKSTHISQSHLTKIENGHVGVSLEILCTLSDILDMSIDYILKGDLLSELDSEKDSVIRESIMRSLQSCSTKQLEHFEEVTHSVIEAMKSSEPKM